MLSGVVQHIYFTEQTQLFVFFMNRISLVKVGYESLWSHLSTIHCAVKKRGMQEEELHSFPRPTQLHLKLLNLNNKAVEKGGKTGESLILWVSTESNPACFFITFLRPQIEISTKPLLMKYLWDLGK